MFSNYSYDESKKYLSFNEQHGVLSKLQQVTNKAPLREKFLFQYGHGVQGATLLACNLVFFRCGFRAFNMYKYTRGRFINLLVSSLFCYNGIILHDYVSNKTLVEHYRIENKWYYGLKSLACHQYGITLCFIYATGSTYLNASLNGMVPASINFLRPGAPRLEGFKKSIARLKPHSKTMAITWLVSSAFMFIVGIEEYQQSCNLLAKFGRKTLSHKED